MRVTAPHTHSSSITSPTTSTRFSRIRAKSSRAPGAASALGMHVLEKEAHAFAQRARPVEGRRTVVVRELVDENAGNADVSRKCDVAATIAEHDALREIDATLGDRATDEARQGFAAFAIPQVRAEIKRVESGAAQRERVRQRAIHVHYVHFAEHSARNAGLVRNDDALEAGGGEGNQRFGDALEEPYAAGIPNEAGVFHQ